MASFFILPLILISLPVSISQTSSNNCNGIFIIYDYNSGFPLPPNILASDSNNQAYNFRSTLTILNNSPDELKSWRVFVGFQHREFLVSASQAVLADGTTLPADVRNGTVFAGFPTTDLKSAIQTAGDINQMEARIELVGTLYGVASPVIPLPSSITLANDGFSCPPSTSQGNRTQVCCVKDSSARSNVTAYEEIQPRQGGDLTIMYDITSSFESNYWAQVTISNNDHTSRLDNWHLSWEWMRDEFIYSMKGAYPTVIDTGDCIFGKQGEHYKGIDFSKALNCEKRPTIIDLPLEKTNDTTLGMVPFCCRNGTILPPIMDASKSKSAFVMQVYKISPDLNISAIHPPQNWKINGTYSPNFVCGPPVRVSPSLFPNPEGLSSDTAVVASWQVICNISSSTLKKTPKCCVSFSAFFNDSVVPCKTCACGCNTRPGNVCSATEPALLLPPQALLVPFDNRTEMATEFASDKRRDLPTPLPCGDNCGVSINWHLLSDFTDGWTARVTLFNWDDSNIVDWFAAVQLDKAIQGFEKAYSFNGTIIPDTNNTIFIQEFSGLNYLLAERRGDNPRKDPPVPGTVQSVISFTKKSTPGIDVGAGDGFPSTVYFNGEECSLPVILPSGSNRRTSLASSAFSLLLTMLLLMVLQRSLCLDI
ncbi:COBRA-like protein 7 [Nicotiana tabacum]|uniref:COBRA-like protein 7 n=1 Tax=Nicotiana tabacum TaxID=4097 RepID=A0A1S4AIT8_TOBAC|nr:PREDICTED: COBRA-like protein 7 [Nicotiana tabacum]